MGAIEPKTIEISRKENIATARKYVQKIAGLIGFAEVAIEELAIVVTELAENLLDHDAINGRIIISEITFPEKIGIEIVSIDDGPGIAEVNAVLEDGFSSTGSLGIGLGAVRRLMSSFKMISQTSNQTRFPLKRIGTTITTQKFLPPKSALDAAIIPSTRFSVFSHSKYGERENGDNYCIIHESDGAFIAVIDALGHGSLAAHASRVAKAYIHDNFQQPLEDIIMGLDSNLRKTRGAAISIAKINDSEGTLSYVGIGNVLTRVYDSITPIRPVNFNGTLGVMVRKYKVFNYPWRIGNKIIMTTDGISTRYNFENQPALLRQHPIFIANYIMKEYGKSNDDATVLVGGPV